LLDLTYVDQLLLLLLLVALPTELVVSYAGHSNLGDQAAFSTNSYLEEADCYPKIMSCCLPLLHEGSTMIAADKKMIDV
jgi:hypothetical protein